MSKFLKIRRKIFFQVIGISLGLFCFLNTANASISVARAFYELARQNNTQKIESLLYRGYSLESVDENGYNPVCIAVSRQDKETYNVLTSYGANKKPSCLKTIPESAYRRFFGTSPITRETVHNQSDAPYWLGVALLGGGATAAAFALGGGSSGGKESGSTGGEEFGKIENCKVQEKDKCLRCEDNYELSRTGKTCTLTIKCPANSKYNSATKQCECNSGYNHFGDNENCYKNIDGCMSQSKNECKACDTSKYVLYDNKCYTLVENCRTYDKGKCDVCEDGFLLANNKCIRDCPNNTHYDAQKKECVCNSGYGKYGAQGDDTCYKTIDNCASKQQVANTCNKCNTNYILDDNACYKKIENCEIQNKDTCDMCKNGYGTHGGNGKTCYENIDNCFTQKEGKCEACAGGFGTHGDSDKDYCYKDVENCADRYQQGNYEFCIECEGGYKASNGECYIDLDCNKSQGLIQFQDSCVCDEKRGFTGEAPNCTQTEGEEYVEGDGHYEVWNDLNAIYCNSRGIYNEITGICSCSEEFSGQNCSECAKGYIMQDGLCYKEIECDRENHRVQQYTSCVCEENYTEINGECIEIIDCTEGGKYKGREQDESGQCVCKPNFIQGDEDTNECICPETIDGEPYMYDMFLDACVKEPKSCDEKNENGKYKWTGENCDECPSNYKITTNEETGELECGLECSENYQNVETGCTECAENYRKDDFTKLCVIAECEDGKDGYIIENNICICNEAEGYYFGPSGRCEQKKEAYIGTKNNKNNNVIEMENEEFRDIYGMKPVKEITDQNEEIYYSDVYNSENYNGAKININNQKSGSNTIYGIYSKSNIYNAAAKGLNKTTANAEININDYASQAIIYGIVAEGNDKNIYNAFAHNIAVYDTDLGDANKNVANATIKITKKDDINLIKGGNITGIKGQGNIYNAYAYTSGELAHSEATGKIDIKSDVSGTIVGIDGVTTGGRVSNAQAYLDGAMSKTKATGTIIVSGMSDIYGIRGSGTVVNSETKFKQNFNIIPEFSSKGEIYVIGKSSSDGEGAYGIYVGGEGTKSEIYNAMGYNTKGIINVENQAGGKAYGIFSESKTHKENINGETKEVYNNTYNAFRSSKIYGGENIKAEGIIDVKLSGINRNNTSDAVGIYANGDVFNSYVNSGSEVKLQSEGIITVNDNIESGVRSTLKGISGGGGTIANAYATGTIDNKESFSKGVININKNINKTGAGGHGAKIIGIEAAQENPSETSVYNAALVKSQSTVDGEININVIKNYEYIYGIYADANGSVGKKAYNAYYEGTAENNEGKVTGKINITTQSATANANIYGMYVKGSVGYNSYTNVENSNVIGEINITSKGSNIKGSGSGNVIGMYAHGAQSAIYNNYNSKINITINPGKIGYAFGYGMKTDYGTAYNNGLITVKATENNNGHNMYGMYANEGNLTNDEKGIIEVNSHGDGYGMYAETTSGNDVGIKVVNKGTINVTSSDDYNSYGIYAINKNEESGKITVKNNGTININKGIGIYASGKNVTVNNNKTIFINDKSCDDGSCIVLENGAEMVNEANITSQGNIDLDSFGGDVLISKNGRFSANGDISGKLLVSSTDVLDNFDKKITLNNAIEAKDVANLDVLSKSYMYDASLNKTSADKHDIDVSLKDFNKITTNDKATYYNLNYNQNNKELFNLLKKQETAKAFSKAEKEIFGEYVLPNIIEEELRVSRSLDNNLMSSLFADTSDDIRTIAGADAVFVGRDDTNNLTGYELDSESMYTLYDKKINNKYRLGLGLSFTHTNTDYNNDSSRKNFMVQTYVPVTYSIANNIKLVSLAKLGYQDGEYTRYSIDNDIYKANTSAITYGLSNELRYALKFDNITLSPFIGLNASGWYNHSIQERGGNLALDIDSSHIFSLESALGLYADFVSNFDNDSKLTTTLGMAYYHEFANPYNSMNARIMNTLGSYKLRNDNLDSKNRGILSAKVNYDYKDFSIYGEIMQYLEEEYPIKLDLGLRYKF